LDRMEAEGRIDPVIDPKLAALASHARTNLDFWQNAENVPKETAFVEYHGWRNVSLVLSAMKDRFQNAATMHENPAVVSEALSILPGVFVTINVLYETSPSQVTERERLRILERVRNLRRNALRCGMLPSPDKELSGVDLEDFRKRLGDLALTIGTDLVET